MNAEPRKVAAALAVIQYLNAERAARAEAAAAQAGPAPAAWPQGTPGASLWASSGRMAVMQQRNLMQLRVFRKI